MKDIENKNSVLQQQIDENSENIQNKKLTDKLEAYIPYQIYLLRPNYYID